MATYASLANLSNRLGSQVLSDLTGGNETLQAEMLDEAQSEIDSHLAPQTTTPVNITTHAVIVPLLRAITLDIAAHKIHALKGAVPAGVRQLYEDRIKWLEGVRDGKIRLPVNTPLDEPDAMETRVDLGMSTFADKAVFTRTAMEGL